MISAVRRSLSLVVLLAASPLVRAGVAERIPPDALFAVAVEDVRGLLRAAEDTAAGRALRSPELAATRDRLRAALEDASDRIRAELGFDPSPLLERIDGPAALVLRVDPEAESFEAGVEVGLLVGCGDAAPVALEVLEGWLDEAVEKGRFDRELEDGPEAEVLVYRPAGPRADGPVLRVSLVGDALLLQASSLEGDGAPGYAGLQEAAAGLGGDALADTAAFQESLAGSGAQGWFYADLEAAVRLGSEEAGDELSDELRNRLFDEAWLGGLRSLSATWSARQGRVSGSVECRVAPGCEILDELRRFLVPHEPRLMAAMPADVATAGSVGFDASGFLDAVIDLLGRFAVGDEDPRAEIEATLRLSDDLDLRRDLLERLGPGYAWILAPVEDDLEALPGTEEDPLSLALVVQLDDGARFSEVLQRLLRMGGLHAGLRHERFQGLEVTVMPLPIPMPGVALELRWTVLDETLVASLSGELLRAVVSRLGGGDLPLLGESEGFATARDRLDADEAVFWGYQDSARGLRTMVAFLEGVAFGVSARSGRPLSVPLANVLERVPQVSFFRRFASVGSISAVEIGEDRILFRSEGP